VVSSQVFIYVLLLEIKSSKSSIQVLSLMLIRLVILFYSLMILQIHHDKSDANGENQPRHTETQQSEWRFKKKSEKEITALFIP